MIRARLITRAVERKVVRVGLQLLTQRKQRGLRQLGEIVGDKPQPAQGAQLHGDPEPSFAAM